MEFWAGLSPLTFVFLSRILFIGRFILLFRSLFVLFVFVALSWGQLLDMSEMSDSYMVENKIHKVKVEGTVHMDDRAVLSRIGIRDGQSYSPTALTEKVQSSVTSLYKSGLFDDVTAWIDYVGEGTDVDLIFKGCDLGPAIVRIGIADLGDVRYAILEQNGSITVIQKAKYQQPSAEQLHLKTKESGLFHIVIDHGTVNQHGISQLGISRDQLTDELKKKDLCISDVYLMMINDVGERKIVPKEKSK